MQHKQGHNLICLRGVGLEPRYAIIRECRGSPVAASSLAGEITIGIFCSFPTSSLHPPIYT